MSIERAMVAGVRSHALAARATDIIRSEASKGCDLTIAPQPVALEPMYTPIGLLGGAPLTPKDLGWVYDLRGPASQRLRFRMWVSPQQRCDWRRAELFLKQLSLLQEHVTFEIVGNCSSVHTYIGCSEQDASLVQAAFRGQFEQCILSSTTSEPFDGFRSRGVTTRFYDYAPAPPYSHLLTRPDQLRRSPLVSLLTTLSLLPEDARGFYQVMFVPVSPEHDWHANVRVLQDLEYSTKLLSGLTDARHFQQQAPSGALTQMAMELDNKAANDKPFYAVAWRIGLCGSGPEMNAQLIALTAVCGLFQHGGRPLMRLSETDYARALQSEAVVQMLHRGLVHRAGFLLNSWELAGLVHVCPPELIEHIPSEALPRLEPLFPEAFDTHGTAIGYCDYAGMRRPVCIDPAYRVIHVHVIGRPGCGKTTVLEHMILDDVERGAGVLLFDPHGDLAERLLTLIPPEHADRTIYMDLGDPEWVPLWNPLLPAPGQDPGRAADDLVSAFKSVITGYGDRLESLLKHSFHGALHVPGSTLMDVMHLLRPKSDHSKAMREAILGAVDSDEARAFWVHDFPTYDKNDLGPPRNKLTKLLLSGTVSWMLSQPDSTINLRQIMDEKRILLVNLANIGDQVRKVLGCFMLALVRLAGLARNKVALSDRSDCHVYLDEAHTFMTDSLERIISEMRKYNVSLTLAHQYLAQFDTEQRDALSCCGSTVIFNVDQRDARYLRKDLRGLVDAEDLTTLDEYQAIARFKSAIIRFRTLEPRKVAPDNAAKRIIERTHQFYCHHVDEVRAASRRRWGVGAQPASLRPGDDADHDTF